MRRLAPLLLLVVLAGVALPLLAHAQSRSAAPPASFSATWTSDGLVVDAEAGAEAVSGWIVVDHVDGLSGERLVDGAAQVDVPAGVTAKAVFAAVRPDVTHDVILTPDAPATLPGTSLYAPLGATQALAQASVGPASYAPRAVTHPVSADDKAYGTEPTRLVFDASGRAVAVYAASGALYAQVSRDGGDSWDAPTTLLDGLGQEGAVFDAALTSSGVMVAAHRVSDGAGDQQPWLLATLDPADGAWRLSGVSVAATSLTWRAGVSVQRDGSVLLAVIAGSGPGPDVDVWRFSATGSAKLGSLATDNPNALRIMADGQGHLALLAKSNDLRQYLYRSTDGATWLGPTALDAILAVDTGEQILGGYAMQEGGTVHATIYAVSRYQVGNESFPPGQHYYVRVPWGQGAVATPLDGPGHDEDPVALAVEGQRVATARRHPVPDPNGGDYLVNVNEAQLSTDGGQSFSSIRYVERAPDGSFTAMFDAALALSPDWRPVSLSVGSGSVGLQAVAVPLFDPRDAATVSYVAPAVTTPTSSTPPPTTTPAPSTPTPTTSMPPSTTTTEPAPTPTTPTPPVDQPLPIVGVSPGIVTLAAGGSADITVTFYNVGATQIGSEAPTLTGLPAGVHAQVQDEGFRVVDGRQSYLYPVKLVADADAPNASVVAAAHARYATDRPALNATFHLLVGGAAAAIAPPPGAQGSGFAMQVPAAAYVMVGTGAAAGVVVILARTDAGKWIAAVATLPLYTRLVKADVLGNEVRAGIHAFAAQHPGARLSEIQRGVDVTTSTLVFHLRVLEREGYLTTSREWSRRRYWVTGNVPVARREGRDVAATLTGILAREPGLGPAAVAARLGISRQLARYHLRALERDGIVVAQGEGIAKGYVVVARR
ncbi:MAG: hypothetical protein QOE90_1423 [Thermoplasmata archaeon]|jgi:DNA-binding MarR family transcriptional regulator|nr:hypothetical protein [Thermoplasmata archaeon]